MYSVTVHKNTNPIISPQKTVFGILKHIYIKGFSPCLYTVFFKMLFSANDINKPFCSMRAYVFIRPFPVCLQKASRCLCLSLPRWGNQWERSKQEMKMWASMLKSNTVLLTRKEPMYFQ